MKIVMQTEEYEVEEGTWPDYALLEPTREWVDKMLHRMAFIGSMQQADTELFHIAYNESADVVVFFNDNEDEVTPSLPWARGGHVVEAGEDFEIPEATDEDWTNGEQNGEVYCETQVVVDEDSFFFRATEPNSYFYFATPEINMKTLLEWRERLSA